MAGQLRGSGRGHLGARLQECDVIVMKVELGFLTHLPGWWNEWAGPETVWPRPSKRVWPAEQLGGDGLM